MANPVISDAVLNSAASGDPIVNLPAVVDVGDLLLSIIYQNGSDAGSQYDWTTNSTGFTELVDSGALPKNGSAYKIADGAEDGTSVTVDALTSTEFLATALRITNWHGTSPPEVTGVESGSDTAPTYTNTSTPSWGASVDTMYIAVLIADFDSGTDAVNSIPSGYTAVTGTDNSPYIYTNIGVIALAYKYSSSGSELPGAWALQNSQQWKVYTIAVRGTAGASNPAITSAGGDDSVFDGETNVPIVGSTFEAVQGTGVVTLSPTDNIADGGAITLPVSSWIDTNITISTWSWPAGINVGNTAYLFVTNDTGNSNASGFPVAREAAPVTYSFTTGVLRNGADAVLANEPWTGVVRDGPNFGTTNNLAGTAISGTTNASGQAVITGLANNTANTEFEIVITATGEKTLVIGTPS